MRLSSSVRPVICAACTVLLAAVPAVGQDSSPAADWVVRSWTTENGLPQNSANALVQTRDGYLWIGTFGGLARFDGARFTVFDVRNAPAIGDARILDLMEDSAGRLWIATQDAGVLQYHGGEFRPVVSSAQIGRAWSLAEAGDGSIWVGGTRGLIRIEPSSDVRVVRFLDDDDAGGHWVVAPAPDGIWAARGPRPVRLYSPLGELLREVPRASSRPALKILTPPRGGAWVGTDSGAEELSDGRFVALPLPGDTVRSVRALTPGPDGDLFGFGDGATRWREDGSPQNIEIVFDSVGPRFAVSALTDREGSIWIGTRGGGLVQMRPAPIRRIATHPDVGTSGVYSIGPDPLGQVLAAVCPGMMRINDRAETTGVIQISQCFDQMNRTSDGRLLVRSTNGRAGWWNGEVFQELGDEVARYTTVDHEGRAHLIGARTWDVLTDEGLETFDVVPPSLIPRLGNIPAILPSGVWLEVGDTVIRLAGGNQTAFIPDDGLPRGQKRWYHEDDRGVVWIATYGGGLSRIEGDSVQGFTTEDGLADDFISVIVEWEDDLWLLGNRSLSRVSRAELEAVGRGEASRVYPVVLGGPDGFREASGSDGVLDDEGRFWFGTIDGPAVIDLVNRPRNTTPPLPIVESIVVDDVPLEPGADAPPLSRRIEIRYTASSFVRPELVQFRFRLRGFSDEWVDAGSRRDAFFTSLSPGSYTFELVAVNSEGVESPTPYSIDIRVRPAFWQTSWFRLLAAITVVGLIALVVTELTATERKRNISLMREIRERRRLEKERELLGVQLMQAQKLEAIGRLTGGIAHDFNNLLMVVTASMEMAQESTREPEVRSAINTAMSAAFRGGALTRQLLSFSRRGPMQNQVIRVPEVFAQVDQMLSRTLGENYRVVVDIDVDVWPCLTDPTGLENAVLNLAINARDAMPGGGPIAIRVSNHTVRGSGDPGITGQRAGDYVCIAVRDRGTGISDDILENVFDPFFTTKELGQGTGLGLSMVHGFAGQSGGFVDIETAAGKGTTVRICLPRAIDPEEAPEEAQDQPDHSGSGESVLLIEDNEAVRQLTARMLADLGYQVLQADTTAEADQMITSGGMPSVILSDILLPGETGVEFAERIRKTAPQQPIVLATGYAPDSLDEAISNYQLLHKPFTRAELARVIAGALSR